jgi:hypothetical protein
VGIAAKDTLFTTARERSDAFVKRGIFYQSTNELQKANDSLQAGCDADPTNATVRAGVCVNGRVCGCVRACRCAYVRADIACVRAYSACVISCVRAHVAIT